MKIDTDFPASAGALAFQETRAGRFAVAGFAVTVALAAGFVCVGFISTRATNDANARIDHSQDVAGLLENTTGVLAAMELADCRYLFTGSARYLSARDAGAKAFDLQLSRLEALLQGDPSQSARLAAVQPLLKVMLSRLATTTSAPVVARSIETEGLSAQISSKLGEMQEEESRLTLMEDAELRRSIKEQSGAFLAQLLLAFAALWMVYVMNNSRIKRRKAATNLEKSARRRIQAEFEPEALEMARARFDFRSALTSILGYCDLPLELGVPVRDRFDSIRDQTVRIISAADDFLGPRRVVPAPQPVIQPKSIFANVDPADSSAAKLPPAMHFTGRVLLAEDDPNLQQVIQYYLQSVGAEVTLVSDGQLAFDQAVLARKQKHSFDLILMDVQMPSHDGRSATIRLRDAGYTDPIVALTANATEQEKARCFAAGCNGFLAKPLDREEFLGTMRRYLQPSVLGLDSSAMDEARSSVAPSGATKAA